MEDNIYIEKESVKKMIQRLGGATKCEMIAQLAFMPRVQIKTNEDVISRSDAIRALTEVLFDEPPYLNSIEKCETFARKTLESIPSAEKHSENAIRCYEFLKGKLGKEIVDNEDEFEAWWERMVWHVKECDRLARKPKQGEWIPCSERLPNEGEVVLVCMRIESHKAEWEEQRSIEFGRISSDRYDYYGTGWEWLNESGADYWQADWDNSILAWMPLPKPWKGSDNE